MSKRNKKRSTLKKRKQRMNYNGIKPSDEVIYQENKYKVIAYRKNSLLLLDNGREIPAKECERLE